MVMFCILKYLLTQAILLSFIFLNPFVASMVSMTLFAQRIHVAAHVTQREAGREICSASPLEQTLHKLFKARFFLHESL